MNIKTGLMITIAAIVSTSSLSETELTGTQRSCMIKCGSDNIENRNAPCRNPKDKKEPVMCCAVNICGILDYTLSEGHGED